jgi:antitoxin VapB
MVRSTLFKTNRTQAVRLPKQVAFPEGIRDVEIVTLGRSRIIAPVGQRWDDLFSSGPRASEDFLGERLHDGTEPREPV